jgi:DNA-binding transcriptional regulator of glucitol operon
VRQLALSPRWMLWHVLTLGAMATCGWLSAWQWHRAGSAMGSALNVGYGLQWPVFAIFFATMWWRMLKMESERLAEGEPAADAPASARGDVIEHATERVRIAELRTVTSDGPSPFGPRPASVRSPVTDEDDQELAEYNRMLAQLAARDAAD